MRASSFFCFAAAALLAIPVSAQTPTLPDFDVAPAVRGYPAFDIPGWAYAATTMARWKGRTGATAAGIATLGGPEVVEALTNGTDLSLPLIQRLATALELTVAGPFKTSEKAYELMAAKNSPAWLTFVNAKQEVTRTLVITGFHFISTGTRAHQLDPNCDQRRLAPVTLAAGETFLVAYYDPNKKP